MKNIKKILAVSLITISCGICYAETTSVVVIPKKESETAGKNFDAFKSMPQHKPLSQTPVNPSVTNKTLPEREPKKEEGLSSWLHKYYKFFIFPFLFYWGMKQFGREKEKKKSQYVESKDVDINELNSSNLNYEIIEHHRLFTNTFVQVRKDKVSGEIYYFASGHLKPELQGRISKEDYDKLFSRS